MDMFSSPLVFAVLGLVLGIPPNTCIVIVNLETIRKKEKLSPSDVIFLAKATVNILLLGLLIFQGMIFVLGPGAFSNQKNLSLSLKVSAHVLTFYSFWLTAWLSAHYWTSITNLSSRVFIWIKRVVSQFLGQVLILTALGMIPVGVVVISAFNADVNFQCSENITVEASCADGQLFVSFAHIIPMNLLGCILPFCISLLCLLLTVSFLVRHVWRVKNNDSGSTHPNLQAHFTALRTIFFFLLMFSFFFMSRIVFFLVKRTTNAINMFGWASLSLTPSAEAAIIVQTSNKLRRILLRRFWIRSWRSPET